MDAQVLIAGGGIVGSGLAWALAAHGVQDIVVVDLDLAGLYASSELNAGGARATWWQTVNIESCRYTLDFFRAHAEEFAFCEKGYLWLYDDAALFARAKEKRTLQNAAGLGVEVIDVGALETRFPLLDRGLDEICGATFSPRDGLVNPNAVRRWYRTQAESAGVRFLNRHYINGIATAMTSGTGGLERRISGVDVVEVRRSDPMDEEGVLGDILTRHRVLDKEHVTEVHLRCETIVNCLGAWSPVFSAKIGVQDVTEPVRRQICLVDVHAEDWASGVEVEPLGMIVDASGLYFHPEGPHILAGFSTPMETPGYDFSYDGQAFFENEIWPRLAHRASSFERCGHVRGWAGLYAVTPDRSGVVGAVRGFANLFEAHSFTGRGVMQSAGVAQAMASLITTGRYEELDFTALSRERFGDLARWMVEDLHI